MSKTATLDNAYAILIGVGADLPASVEDAKALYDLLADPDLAGYKKENITLLTEEKATRENIITAFDTLIDTVDEDASVFLFYSGHGGTYTDNDILELEHPGKPLKPEDENQSHYYLQPNDFDVKKYRETWVHATELKQRIHRLRSRRLILFLDCCHAEGMTKSGNQLNTSELKNRLRNPEGLIHRIDDGRGISIISSCRAEEVSWILEEARNSLFTTCLLEVLQGKHKTSFEEPYIRMTDAINYLMKTVPQRKPTQRPFVNLQMYDDFILSRIPGVLIKDTPAVSDPAGAAKGKVTEVKTRFRQTEAAANAVIFVHGFSGEAADTFGEIPEFIMKDPQMEGWDLFPMGYSQYVRPGMGKGIWATVADIDRIADNVASAIQHRFSRYKRIALVGHSLGGLVIQRALLDLPDPDRNKLSHVFLFATPSGGVQEGSVPKHLFPKLKELHADAPFITMLRKEWKERFAGEYPFTFKVVAGTEDVEIPIVSNFGPFDEEHRVTVAGNHFSMVQPTTQEHDGYRLIVDGLTNSTFFNKYTDDAQINMLLGEYEAVIRELLPKKDTITLKGLKQLLFALEGMDRHEEVLEILDAHPLSRENSDLLGMLGGRFKRRFLQDYSAVPGVKAMEYYKKGLAIAKEQGNNEKIYYHAINIAFMSLVYEEDRQSMQEYAQQALKAAEDDPFDSVWKQATVAEAQLYLANLEAAKAHYAKAAERAGVREKLSIHTNAYTAYTSLMHTEDDDFITFLKLSFLT
ncbi:alpha/beta fold hydrolase [uncultured Altibacter sp.]|uniref:alpha/beta fold hydrolase n=1 Tax=uncultured Altibacter sp. TaxID=2506933 RepID=UPI0030D6E2D1